MTHGSLFSGIGGFDKAAEWAGWENQFHCEWNEFGQRVLNYYWPKAISYGDITKTDFTIWRGRIDVLSGDFLVSPTHFREDLEKMPPPGNVEIGKFQNGLWAKIFGINWNGVGIQRCRLIGS